MTLTAVLLELAGCAGLGAWLLRGLGLLDSFAPVERWAWSFCLGDGIAGWLIFPMALAGWIAPWQLALPFLLGLTGLRLLLATLPAISMPQESALRRKK